MQIWVQNCNILQGYIVSYKQVVLGCKNEVFHIHFKSSLYDHVTMMPTKPFVVMETTTTLMTGRQLQIKNPTPR